MSRVGDDRQEVRRPDSAAGDLLHPGLGIDHGEQALRQEEWITESAGLSPPPRGLELSDEAPKDAGMGQDRLSTEKERARGIRVVEAPDDVGDVDPPVAVDIVVLADGVRIRREAWSAGDRHDDRGGISVLANIRPDFVQSSQRVRGLPARSVT